MALKFFDGFDHYATADLLKKWTSGTTGNTITANGRRSGSCLSGTPVGSLWLLKTYGGTVDTAIAGCAINQTSSISATTQTPIRFMEGGTCHVAIAMDGSGFLRAYRGSGTTLLGTAVTGALTAGSFYYIEAKVKVHDTAGTVEIRVNGATVLSLTLQDTRNGGTGYIDGVGFLPALATSGGAACYIDDVYICDGSGGSPNNDFLGDVRVDTLFPTADGTYSAFTPSTGSSHYQLVDEATPNTSDYNSGAASGDTDTYAMGDLSAVTGTIFGIQVCDAVLKDDAGARSAATQIRSGGTDATGASTALSTSQLYLRDIWATDPNTSSAWTETNINAMEAGCKVTA